MGGADDDIRLVLDPKQADILRDTWFLAQSNLQKLSIQIFERLFELDPDLKKKFSFLGDDEKYELDTTSAKTHASIVLHVIGDTLSKMAGFRSKISNSVDLNSDECSNPRSSSCPVRSSKFLKQKENAAIVNIRMRVAELGRRHADYCVQAEHFGVLKRAINDVFLDFFKEAYTSDVKDAWASAIDYLASIMIRAMEDKEAGKITAQPLNEIVTEKLMSPMEFS